MTENIKYIYKQYERGVELRPFHETLRAIN